MGAEVDADVSEAQRCRSLLHRHRNDRRARRRQLAQVRLEAGDQLATSNRLGQVVVGPGVETADHAGLVVAAADEDDDHGRVLGSNRPAHLGSGPIRQHPVEKDRDRLLAREGRQAGLGRGAGDHLESLALDERGHELGGIGAVVDDQDRPAFPRHGLMVLPGSRAASFQVTSP